MKKMLFAVMVPMFLFSGFLCAGDYFLRLQRRYQAVLDDWRGSVSSARRDLVRNSPDPQIRRELRFHQELLEKFLETSREIQKNLDELGLSEDVPLTRHAENLRGAILLYERATQNDQTGTRKWKNSPRIAFRVIEADLEGLKDMGFTCENGVGVLSPEARAWPEFYRYRRHLRMLKLYLDIRKNSTQLNMSMQKNEIPRDFPDITESADRLSAKVQQEFPYLRQEGIRLQVLTRKLLDDTKLQTTSAGLKNPATSPKGVCKPDQTLSRIESNLQKIENHIRASIRKMKEEESRAAREKQKTAPEPESVRPSSDPVRPGKTASASAERKREVPLERRSEEELNRELMQLRKRILPDTSRRKLTADELEQCLDLLSERERKQYETIRLRQIRNGSDHYAAPLEALKELKELLTAPDAVLPSKQEKIQILKKAEEMRE